MLICMFQQFGCLAVAGQETTADQETFCINVMEMFEFGVP